MRVSRLAVLGSLALFTLACTRRPVAPPVSLRLVDAYKPELIQDRVTPPPAPARTEWRFDGAPPGKDANRGWSGFHGVAGLQVRGERLAGQATTAMPMLHLERPAGFDDGDLIHEVQVRVRASAGTNLSVGFDRAEKPDASGVLDALKAFGWDFTSPLVAGPEMRTYTLRSPLSVPTAGTRHVFVRPTDAAGATFELESVRLVTRREHLSSVASGVGWQGLGEIYRESLVARSPEVLRFDLRLPPHPRLELALGTVEDGPVTFQVAVEPQGGSKETVVLERTVTRPHRWEEVPIDLGAFASRDVSLRLALRADRPGTLGLWGGPAVRSVGARPDATAPAPGGAAPRGVILIWADTLRRDHLSLYGYGRPTSPVLDRLGREGAVFRDCVGQASWTKVATPSMMTSLFPTTHGVREFADRLPSAATTLAEVYRQAGYATLSLSSILFTGKFTNLHQGFETVHEDGSLPDRRSSKTAREYVDRLLPWLDAHRDVPFFVFLHVSDPHDPYKPQPPYDTLWADARRAAEHERQAAAVRKVIRDPLLKMFGMPTGAELTKAHLDPQAYAAHDRDWYDGSIRGMDAEIGRLVERIRGLGLERDVVVAFTGDHGEEFLEHGRMFHGQSVYGEMNNMPLLVWAPGRVPAGTVVEETVAALDVMPTLLELSRLPVPAEAQGRSLVPLVGAPGAGTVRAAGDPPPALSEKAAITDTNGPPPRETDMTAIVAGGFKLIHNRKAAPGRPEFELYDRRTDLLDGTDVAAQHPEVVQRLSREMALWRAKAEQARLKPDADAAKGLTKEELERLRSLGYIQ
jgi:arylsulfatase A-like enzyme